MKACRGGEVDSAVYFCRVAFGHLYPVVCHHWALELRCEVHLVIVSQQVLAPRQPFFRVWKSQKRRGSLS